MTYLRVVYVLYHYAKKNSHNNDCLKNNWPTYLANYFFHYLTNKRQLIFIFFNLMRVYTMHSCRRPIAVCRDKSIRQRKTNNVGLLYNPRVSRRFRNHVNSKFEKTKYEFKPCAHDHSYTRMEMSKNLYSLTLIVQSLCNRLCK